LHILDAIILVLLIAGNVLALPIWWWLLFAPPVRAVERRTGKSIPGPLS